MSQSDSDSDTRGYGALSGMTYQCPGGGDIHVPPADSIEDGSQTAGVSAMTPHGTGFGPLQLSAYPESLAVIQDLVLESPSSSWFDGWGDGDSDGAYWSSLGVVGGAAAADRDENGDSGARSTRRNLLKVLGGGALLASAAAGVASATETLTTASFDLSSNPGGLRVQILDGVDGLLPVDQQYYALVDGMDYATFSGGSDGSADLPPTLTGSTSIDTSVGFLDGPKTLAGRKKLSYEEFELETNPTELSPGTLVPVTSHPFVVDAVLQAGASATTLNVAGETIPHYEESSDADVGVYRVRNGRVVYRVGAKAPSGTKAAMSVYAGLPGEKLDDAKQVI